MIKWFQRLRYWSVWFELHPLDCFLASACNIYSTLYCVIESFMKTLERSEKMTQTRITRHKHYHVLKLIYPFFFFFNLIYYPLKDWVVWYFCGNHDTFVIHYYFIVSHREYTMNLTQYLSTEANRYHRALVGWCETVRLSHALFAS